ncbi:MAG: hypothetical protein ABR505_04225, partial [Actinomycetota bacterium]
MADQVADPTSGPGALWWRVSILEPSGRTVEVDTPSGWTLPDWQTYAERQGAARKVLLRHIQRRIPVEEPRRHEFE